MIKLKDLAQIGFLAFLCIAICSGIVEAAIWINKPFAYLLSISIAFLVIWGAVEIYERAK
jgi:uncharacterized membrane protein